MKSSSIRVKGFKTLNTKITDSEDGTIVRAIESIPENVREREKFDKTDNK